MRIFHGFCDTDTSQHTHSVAYLEAFKLDLRKANGLGTSVGIVFSVEKWLRKKNLNPEPLVATMLFKKRCAASMCLVLIVKIRLRDMSTRPICSIRIRLSEYAPFKRKYMRA